MEGREDDRSQSSHASVVIFGITCYTSCVSDRENESKGQAITMRADAATARELHEIAEVLSSEFVKASLADALRAVVKVGAPILRERLLQERGPSTRSSATQAPGNPAERDEPKQ
jgi:hypothetical protein